MRHGFASKAAQSLLCGLGIGGYLIDPETQRLAVVTGLAAPTAIPAFRLPFCMGSNLCSAHLEVNGES
jgi:hypothetical protein